MNEETSVIIYIRETVDHKFQVATAQSPFFCFEAASKDEAINKASRALDFHHQASKELDEGP